MNNEKKLKTIYKQLKGFLKQLPCNNVTESIVNGYHRMVDELIAITNEDYLYLKISEKDSFIGGESKRYYEIEPLKVQVGSAIGILEGLLDVEESNNIKPNQIIQILNQNKNTLAVNIEQSIIQLVEEETNEEIKIKLKELDEELEKKDRSKVGQIMKWFIEKGLMDLLIRVLPEIMKRL